MRIAYKLLFALALTTFSIADASQLSGPSFSIYDMTKPGKYTIQVERVDDESKAVMKSDAITVTVTGHVR